MQLSSKYIISIASSAQILLPLSRDPKKPEIGSQERRRRIIAEKSKKRHIVAVNGLLHRKQNLRITAPDTATKREGKLFFSFFTDRP